MFQRQHLGICPITNIRYRFTCYHITDPGNIIERPRTGSEFWKSINSSTRTLRVDHSRKRQRTSVPVVQSAKNLENRNLPIIVCARQ